jgi:hypothetical protein
MRSAYIVWNAHHMTNVYNSLPSEVCSLGELSMKKITRRAKRILGAAACGFAALAVCSAAEAQVIKPKQSLGGPLTLQDEGSFFVHGKNLVQWSGCSREGSPGSRHDHD